MKIQKQWWIALAAVAGALCWQSAAPAASRVESPWSGAHAAQWRERMRDAATDLHLSADQKARLKENFQPRMEKLREVWKDRNLSREQKIEKLKALRAESEPKLKEILTPEQLEQLKLKQRRNPAGERISPATGDGSLTEEQKTKLKAIFQPQMGKLREVWKDQDLTPREKKEKFKAMREEISPQIKELLTPGQYKKWEEARARVFEKVRDRWQQRRQP